MASYNWEQVKKAISDNGLVFSDADLALAQKNPDAGMSLVNYKLDYAKATTDDQKALAHAGAEKIRSDYGRYTGGADGSKFYVNEPSPMSFEYGNAGSVQSSAPQTSEFENPYADQTQAALDKVMNPREWSYDPVSDPAYQAARKQYLREGKRATEDTLGQFASMTGGMPSTAAVTAAAQAGQYYNTQLSDQLANYRNEDYQRYVDALGMDFDRLSAINSMSQQARDEFDTDRNFGYNQWTDELGFQSDKENTALENERYKTEYGDAMTMDMYNLLMTDYEATGNADALKRARAILTALQNNMNS